MDTVSVCWWAALMSCKEFDRGKHAAALTKQYVSSLKRVLSSSCFSQCLFVTNLSKQFCSTIIFIFTCNKNSSLAESSIPPSIERRGKGGAAAHILAQCTVTQNVWPIIITTTEKHGGFQHRLCTVEVTLRKQCFSFYLSCPVAPKIKKTHFIMARAIYPIAIFFT